MNLREEIDRILTDFYVETCDQDVACSRIMDALVKRLRDPNAESTTPPQSMLYSSTYRIEGMEAEDDEPA